MLQCNRRQANYSKDASNNTSNRKDGSNSKDARKALDAYKNGENQKFNMQEAHSARKPVAARTRAVDGLTPTAAGMPNR
jgi:hypothetical protein